MRTLARRAALVLPFLLAASPLAAQAKKKKPAAAKPPAKLEEPAPATPTKLEVVQVNDRRSSGHFASAMVHVTLPGVNAKDVAAKKIVATKAVDDTGKDLLEGAMQDTKMSPTANAMGLGMKMGEKDDDGPPGLPLTLTLGAPARGASAIRELTGEIELYMPSKDPNSSVKVEKFLGQLGKALKSPALAANGVEITLVKLTPEEGELVVKVKDPGKRVQDFWYVNPAGEPQRVMASEREGATVLSSWSGKPQADWALKIDLKSPKALVRHTFTLADVALP
jgi:hypothetical protein